MREELIIDNQRVDLAGAPITLEWASGILGDLGSIQLSRSYTIALPATTQNRRIFDDPSNPAHKSAKVRRYLSARYYRDGIDLLGDAQAYLLDASSKGYEIALVWNALPELQALSSNKETLQDLPNLPVLTWVGSNGTTPDYGSAQGGAVFARYDSGLGLSSFPDENAASHPAMGLLSLIDSIMTNAGVPYSISSERVREAMSSLYLLAAPSHRPNEEMEALSGCDVTGITVANAGRLRGDVYRAGWDTPFTGTSVLLSALAGSSKAVHFALRLRAPLSTAMGSDASVVISSGTTELARVPFEETEYGYDAVADLEVEAEQWGSVNIGVTEMNVGTSLKTAASGYPPLTMWRVHEHILISEDNRFPIAENLPALEQWDFIKACMVLTGAVPVIQNKQLVLMGYEELLDTSRAYDWTLKMTGSPTITQRMTDWARRNLIVFAPDDTQTIKDPTGVIYVDDETVAASRNLYELPFAASQGSAAIHYRRNDKDELEDVEIEPRVMKLNNDALVFTRDMSGAGLISARYAVLQKIVENPVLVTAVMRLSDLDLAALDLRRPVYLQQLGHYYAIQKVQAEQTQLCKVELIQLT